MRTIRIGSGAGFSNDRVEPGIELLEKGQLDYFCLECLAERTIAIAQKEKNLDPNIEDPAYRRGKTCESHYQHGWRKCSESC